VNAADTDGTISKVEYYRGGTTLIGTSTTAPFSLNWNSVAAGTYSVTAKAYDNFNVSTTSSAISIKVNAAPTISITSPANAATFNNAPTSVTINTNATDSDGTISKVEFYSNGGLIGTITASPFNYTWNSVAAGTYSLTAKATDNNGGVTTSSAVSITVNSGSNVCANIPQYSTTATYVDGSQVQNVGNYYQCKPYPYTGWCNNPAYAPGTTTYWPDAWTLLGSCTGRMGAGKEVVQMDFYPNPAQSSVVINFNSVNEGTANVMITDMYSKKVMETDMSVVAGSNSVELNLENVFNGIYMVTITKGNDKIVKQLVISK
jgi:chitinase